MNKIFEELGLSTEEQDELGEECLSQLMFRLLSLLSEQQSRVLNAYFGMNSQHPQTLREIAKAMNLSKSRVGQIKQKAIRILRHPSRFKLALEEVKDSRWSNEPNLLVRELRRSLLELEAKLVDSNNRLQKAEQRIDRLERHLKRPDVHPLSDQPFEDLFTVRTATCLKCDDILTIGDILKRNESQLLSVPNLGRMAGAEIKAVLAERGLSLKAT